MRHWMDDRWNVAVFCLGFSAIYTFLFAVFLRVIL